MRISFSHTLLFALLGASALGRVVPACERHDLEDCVSIAPVEKRGFPGRPFGRPDGDGPSTPGPISNPGGNPWGERIDDGSPEDKPEDKPEDRPEDKPESRPDDHPKDRPEVAPENVPDADLGPRPSAEQITIQREKGRQNREQLNDVITEDRGDRPDNFGSLEAAGFRNDAGPGTGEYTLGSNPWLEHGNFGKDGKDTINPNVRWNMDIIKDKDADPFDFDKKPYVHMLSSAEQKTIVNKGTWKEGGGPNPNLDPNQVVMFNWRATAGGPDRVKDLRHNVRHNIEDHDRETTDKKATLNTQKAMNEAFAMMGKNSKDSRKDTLVIDADGKGMEGEAFELLAAQTHVRMVYHLLKDYRRELGNLVITRLHLIHKNHKDSDGKYHMVIDVEPK